MVQSLHRKRALRTALLLLLMTAGATKVFAQFTDPDGYFKYTITDYENHYVAIGYFPNTTNLPDNYMGMLPSTVTYENVTYTVTSLANSAFGNCNKLLAVGIPETVTSISDYAFTGCENLQSVGIPNSVENIGVGVFYHCTSLQSAKWPENNDCWKIPSQTFEGCTSLRTYTIPDHVTTIDVAAFKDCTGLQEVYLSSTLNHINANAFNNCSALIGVYSYNLYPPLINAETFTGAFATNAKIYVPSESLYRYQTEYWEESVNFAWPVRSTDITADKIEVMPAHKFLTYENFSVDHNILARVTGYRAGISGDLVIPSIVSSSYVTEIVPQALENCTSITSVIFPETMKTIGDHAFSGCTGLTTIDLSACNEMTTTGKRNFVDCDNVTTVLLPANLTTIGNHAFASCNALASIEIPGAVTCIETGAFQGCTALSSITFPKSVGIIEQQAFQGCTALGSITALRTLPPRAHDNTFDGVTKTIPVNIPNGATANYNTAAGWSDFTNFVELPANTLLYSYDEVNHTATITGYIGEVSGVLDIPSVVTKNSVDYTVTAIGDNAFMGCSDLIGVTFPATLTSLGQYAFRECTGITSVVIPSTLTTIGDGAFLWCTSLAEVSLPDNMTRIGKGMFEGAAFTEIQLPNSLQVIDKLAFYATGLTTLTIPASVTTIGAQAFKDCLDLEYVAALPTTPPTINANSFEDVERIPLYMPAASYDAYHDDPLWSTIFDITHRPGLIYNTETTTAIVAGCTPNYVGAVEIPATWGSFSVVGIKWSAFNDQPYITSISIPASVTNIEFGAIMNCESLQSITLAAGNTSYKTDATGALLTMDNKGLIAFPCGKTITSYDIPEGVEQTWHVFDGNKSLQTIYIPRSLTFGNDDFQVEHAFYGLDCLTTLTVPSDHPNYQANNGVLLDKNGTKVIYCPRGKAGSYAIPNTVTTVDRGAFYGCKNLTNVTIPNTVSTIEANAFRNCESLTSVVIPTGIVTDGDKTIESEAFRHCTSLTAISIPDGIIEIKSGAFAETGITSLYLPASVTALNEGFYDCLDLSVITCDATTPPTGDAWTFDLVATDIPVYVPYASLGAYQQSEVWNRFTNIQANPDASLNLVYSYNDSDLTATVTGYTGTISGDLVIPGMVKNDNKTYTVTAIADETFKNCTELTSVTTPHTLETIGASAFESCTGMESVVIGRNVKSIGSYAFKYCYALVNIDYYAVNCGSLNTTIWYDALAYNKNLTIRNSVKSIPSYAFFHLPYLTSVTIPNSTESIGEYAFAGNSQLTSFTMGSNVKTIGYYAFRSSGITSIDLLNVETVGEGIFEDCTELQTVTLRNSLSTLKNKMFNGCTSLNNVHIPSGVRIIGNEAFKGCTSLTNLVFDNPIQGLLTTIGESAFESCGLTSVDIPSTVTTVETWAFYGNTNLTTVTIGTGMQYMGSNLFYNCTNLATVNYNATHCHTIASSFGSTGNSTKTLRIGNNVNYIPGNAFAGLNLASVTIPNGVTAIGEYAFYDCANITEINIPNSVTYLGEAAFAGNRLETITLGSGLVSIGDYAFGTDESQQYLQTVTSYNVTPPTIFENTFNTGDYTNAMLYVLGEAAVTAYGSADYWQNFTNIQSIDGYYFTGATNSNWGTASNWSNGTVPTTACIDSWEPDPTTVNVIIMADATVNVTDAYAFNLTVMDGNVVTVTDGNKLKLGYYQGLNSDNGSFTATDASALVINEGGSLMNAFEMQAAVEKNITGYGNGSGNWYFISSPLKGENLYNNEYYYDNPDDIENLTEGNYDLYLFDQAQIGMEWQNYKAHQEEFRIRRGQGYLYANEENTTLQFAGTIAAIEGDDVTYPVDLSYQDEPIQVENPDAPEGYEYVYPQLAGWNLIGNPFAATAYQDMMMGSFNFYMMNDQGIALAEEGVTNVAIPACTGIFVKSDSPYQTFTFTTQNPEMMRPNNGSLNVTLQQSVERGTATTIDNAIVSFNEGSELEKFVFNAETSKLYIPQDGKDYAIVWSEGRGEVPVNFKATRNGSYTITVSPSEVSMAYLHLIDNLTGDNIDLLETQSYTFEAKTSDYASRFKLVFTCGDANDDNETFAFFNGSEWVISNESLATLQVVDVIGRVLRSETVSGNASISLNQTPGVYMLRLISGDSVNVQKIVVK